MNKSEEIKAVIGSLFDSILSEKNLETEQRIHHLTQEQKDMLLNSKNDFWIECALSEIKDVIVALRGLPMYDDISTALIDGSMERFFSLYIEKTEGEDVRLTNRDSSVEKSRSLSLRAKTSHSTQITREKSALLLKNTRIKPIGLPKISRIQAKRSESI